MRVALLLFLTTSWCVLAQPTRPTVEEVTPRTGGETRYWTPDYSMIVGESWVVVAGEIINWKTWLWTSETQTVWLDAIVKLPEYCRPESVRLEGGDYRLLMISCPEHQETAWPYTYNAYLVRLPRDPQDWCTVGDMDHDDDVDQTDFGLFQRCLSGPGVVPTADCWSADLDCDRDVDDDDMRRVVALMMGAK